MRKARVEALRRLTPDTVELTLAPDEVAADPIEAGAHLRMVLPGGFERSYSLCNPGDASPRYVIAVKREPQSRGGSAAIHELRVNDSIDIEGPFNAFAVNWSQPRLVLIAGGIGITPIYAMAREAARRGHDFVLHYFVRSTEHAAYLDALQRAPWSSRVRLHVGLQADAVRASVASLLQEDAVAAQGVYVCGPRPLIDLTCELAAPLSVCWESFGGGREATPPVETETDHAFEISLTSGEGPFLVPPGKSALAVLLEAGLDVPFSCREGECGMCVVDVVEGEPEHRDRFLSAAARAGGGCMALCVSRARGTRIVVDF